MATKGTHRAGESLSGKFTPFDYTPVSATDYVQLVWDNFGSTKQNRRLNDSNKWKIKLSPTPKINNK